MFTFPRIITQNTPVQQADKIGTELAEFQAANGNRKKDEEALDILQAAETLVRLQFMERECEINMGIEKIVEKNHARGYYTTGADKPFNAET